MKKLGALLRTEYSILGGEDGNRGCDIIGLKFSKGYVDLQIHAWHA